MRTGTSQSKTHSEPLSTIRGTNAATPLGNIAAPPKEACPDHLQWSAFGADYMDTACVNGWLIDLDHDGVGCADIPCPFCQPPEFTQWRLAGTAVWPTCSCCLVKLPDGTAINYHDGKALTWSAHCPTCGPRFVLMRDYGDDAPQFRSQVHAGVAS